MVVYQGLHAFHTSWYIVLNWHMFGISDICQAFDIRLTFDYRLTYVWYFQPIAAVPLRWIIRSTARRHAIARIQIPATIAQSRATTAISSMIYLTMTRLFRAWRIRALMAVRFRWSEYQIASVSICLLDYSVHCFVNPIVSPLQIAIDDFKV